MKLAGISLVCILQLGTQALYTTSAFAWTAGEAAPIQGFSLQKKTHDRLMVGQKKSPFLFRIKSGVFCTTPLESNNGTLITGCDDGNIRFISSAGALIKTLPIGHDPNAGLASNPEVVALKGDGKETFVATSYVDRLVMKFDANGKVLSRTVIASNVSEPHTFGNGDYFYYEDDGIAHFEQAGKTAITVAIGTTDMHKPVVRVVNGVEEAIMGSNVGNIVSIRSTGEVKRIKLGSRPLGETQLSPDGKIWVSDDGGTMYIVDVDAETAESFKSPLNGVLSRPLFLKNGKVAFSVGDYVLIYDQKDLMKPMAVHEPGLYRDDFYAGRITDYISSPMKGIDLGSIILADGSEVIWVPTYGGYHFIDDQGSLIGYQSYGAGNGDAETFSPPVKLKDGTFAMGLYCGIDRYSLGRSNTKKISGSNWTRDQL